MVNGAFTSANQPKNNEKSNKIKKNRKKTANHLVV
jgi:hypothetical protein